MATTVSSDESEASFDETFELYPDGHPDL